MKSLSIHFLFGTFGKLLRNYMSLVSNHFDKNTTPLEEEGKKTARSSLGESFV